MWWPGSSLKHSIRVPSCSRPPHPATPPTRLTNTTIFFVAAASQRGRTSWLEGLEVSQPHCPAGSSNQGGGGVEKLGMTVRMADADAPHLQCFWHLNGWVVFLGPVVSHQGSMGRPALMRSQRVSQCWWGQRGSSSFDEVSCTDGSGGAIHSHNEVAKMLFLSTVSVA